MFLFTLIFSILFANLSFTVSQEFQKLTTRTNYTLSYLNLTETKIQKKLILVHFINKDNFMYQDQIFLSNTQLAIIKKFRYTLFNSKIEKIIIKEDPVVFLLYLNYLHTGKLIDFRYIINQQTENYFIYIYLKLINFPKKFDNYSNILDQWKHSAKKPTHEFYISPQEVHELFSQEIQKFITGFVGKKKFNKIAKKIEKQKIIFEYGFL